MERVCRTSAWVVGGLGSGANVDADRTQEKWITLSGRVATVRNRLAHARADTTQDPARTQELPAVYTWARLPVPRHP